MRIGDVVGDRFQIERRAGSGGMGAVYRARDLCADRVVALKVVHRAVAKEPGRFAREALALASLRHPAIVRYVAHGSTPSGEPYLAMQWLHGETLAERLAREPLSIAELLTVAARLAEALGVVHRAGVVHRDLKPSNLFLVGGAAQGATLIDFGLALVADLGARLTATGVVLGTPRYIAPEQARGEPDVDARADVFSLGCVLFQCLTGRPPFVGDDAWSVMLKMVLDEAPRLRDLRPDLPVALAELVDRMLSKSPAGRPRDGAALAAELRALDEAPPPPAATPPGAGLPGVTPPSVYPRLRTLGRDERRIVALVLARDAGADADETRSDEAQRERVGRVEAVARRWQGALARVAGHAPAIVLASAGAPTDLATRAARCALELRALGDVSVALVMGHAEPSSRAPLGELIDRAVPLLGRRARGAEVDAVRVDEITAGLLGARFDVRAADAAAGGGGLRLAGERAETEAPPVLLGRATPYLGRDRELSLLETAFLDCAAERLPNATLVTAPAGAGKSRLRYELVRRLRARGEPLDVWLGRGDPLRAGSAFGLIAQALRHALGLFDDEPAEAQREKITRRVEQRGIENGARVAAFLGEIAGAPFPDEHDAQLRAARGSAALMNDQLRAAWEDFVRAECAAQPVLLVLEDLHWGDRPTVALVDAALRLLRDRPLMVLALARPDVHAVFPELWAGRSLVELRLTALPRRAAERLVREVLGEGADAALVAAIVQRADGNAFYLEELIRAAAEGRGAAPPFDIGASGPGKPGPTPRTPVDIGASGPGKPGPAPRTPETVLAMVQARLETIDGDARRALRAASVFGEAFSPQGVAALLGGADASVQLDELERREAVVRRRERSHAGEVELRFRHALVRDAAYGMLTQEDRETGHWLAGEWLERTGAGDALVLAEHFERGKDPARAARWYRDAAEQALRGDDLEAALERAERGSRCDPDAEILGALRFVQAEAHLWRGEFDLAQRRATQAVDGLPLGSAGWFRAVAAAAIAAGKLGDYEGVERWAELAREIAPGDDAASAKWTCLGDCAAFLAQGGRYGVTDALCEAIHLGSSDGGEPDAETGQLHLARALRALAAGDTEAARRSLEASLAAFERAGDRRNACATRGNLGYVEGELGDYERAEATLRAALADADRMGLTDPVLVVLQNLGAVLARRGRLEEAKAVLQRAVEGLEKQRNLRMANVARAYLAGTAALAGDLDAAEREARAAAEALRVAPPVRALALAVLAGALLGLGRAAEALAAAEEAMEVLRALGEIEEGESLVRLAHAVALAEAGRPAEAAAAIAAARDRLLARAAKIADPDARRRFLAIAENAETLARAEAWIAGGPAPDGD